MTCAKSWQTPWPAASASSASVSHVRRAGLVRHPGANRGHDGVRRRERGSVAVDRLGELRDRALERDVAGRAQEIPAVEQRGRGLVVGELLRRPDLAAGGDAERRVRLEHVEMVDGIAEAVLVLGHRHAARLRHEREGRAALPVPVGGLETELRVRLVDRAVVGEPGHVLDAQPHCCCCASCIATAPAGRARLEKYAFVDARRPPSGSRSGARRGSGSPPVAGDVLDIAVGEVDTRRPRMRWGRPWSVEIRVTASRLVDRQERTARGKSAERISSSAIVTRLEEGAVALHEGLERTARLEQRDQLPRAGRVVLVERDRHRVAGRDHPHGRRARARGGGRGG